MAAEATQFHPTQNPAVLAASRIGTWQWNIPNDQVNCDQTNARLLGLTAKEANEGVPLKRIVEAVHPDDREFFRSTTAPARAQGGSVSVVVRMIPSPTETRRIIVRGHYAPDTGYGRGVLIDVTDLEAADLDRQLGAFEGRMERDRWREQARLLAKGDRATYEAQFGRLG